MTYSIKKSPGWDQLGVIGNSKLIRSFSIWFIAIPILAKLTEKMSGTFSLGIFDPPLILNWGIPFSLQVLYAATICFTFSNILYARYAPEIIKGYNSFSDFKEKDGSFEKIKQMFELLLEKNSEEYQYTLLVDFFSHVPVSTSEGRPPKKINEHFANLHFDDLRKVLDQCTVDKEDYAEAFSNIKGAAAHEHKNIQWLTLGSYYLGFACLGYLFIENAIYVFSY